METVHNKRGGINSPLYFERFPTVSTKIRTVTSTVSNGCQRFPQKHRGLSSAAAPCCRHGRHQRGQRIHPRERPPGPRKFDAAQPRSSPWLTARMLSPARGGRQTAAAAEVTTKTVDGAGLLATPTKPTGERRPRQPQRGAHPRAAALAAARRGVLESIM